MGKHQIIYTSCRRGRDGGNDGQQIYSYDAAFREKESDKIKRLFTYQVPNLPSGVVMTKEIAKTMPQEYSYQILEENLCAFTQNTYLGKDYMGEAGRYGNHLSHVILSDIKEIENYPCEYYGSTTLRSNMSYEEVNNPNPPDYLPEPILETGDVIQIETIIEFLNEEDRMELYKQMLHAILIFPTEKKRLILCDKPEQIILWIAALEYALPLELAKTINFTTYEYDPELSAAQICGVISSGTKYQAQIYRENEKHFVFDLFCKITPTFQLNSEFFDFIETAMSFSYESLQDFHCFLMENYTYREVGEGLYQAYILYILCLDGIENIERETFGQAIIFQEKYIKQEKKFVLADKLLSETEYIITLEHEYILKILSYLLSLYEEITEKNQKIIKDIIIKYIFILYNNPEIKEKEFYEIYNTIDELGKKISLNLAAELMKQENRKYFIQTEKQEMYVWKLCFIIKVLCDYIKTTQIEIEDLYKEQPIGAVYSEFIKAAYYTNKETGNLVVKHILDKLEDNWKYITYMVLMIEQYIFSFSLPAIEIKPIWNYFYNIIIEKQKVHRKDVLNLLFKYNKYEQVYELYQIYIKKIIDFKEAKELYYEYKNEWFIKNPDFETLYLPAIIEEYLNVIFYYFKNNKSTENEKKLETETEKKEETQKKQEIAKESEKEKRLKTEKKLEIEKQKELLNEIEEMFHIILDHDIDTKYLIMLLSIMTESMSLVKLDTKDIQILEKSFDYFYKKKKQIISGKLLLFIVRAKAEYINNKKSVMTFLEMVSEISGAEGVSLRQLQRKEAYLYMEQILEPIILFSETMEDIKTLYFIFRFSKEQSNDYFELCAKGYFEQWEKIKNYKKFSEFLIFLFEEGDTKDWNMVCELLSKLNKTKLEEFNQRIERYFTKEKKYQKKWNELYETAVTKSSLLKNITSIFKKKKE